MLLAEEDSEAFKRWVLPKLETISDADAEVLADYVVALVTTEDTDANIRRNCLESLSDFLQDNTASFVDEVIGALKTKSYVKGNAPTTAPAPIPSIVGTSTSEYLPNPAHALNLAPLHAPKGPAASRQQEQSQRSRKRKQNDRDASQSREGVDVQARRPSGNDRPTKQVARRGGRNGRGGSLNAQAPAFAPVPNMPPFNIPFGEIPPFDPTNPMAFLAMAAAFGVNLPGLPPLPTLDANASNVRCADYDTKGFCAAGSLCPYQHGLEYDPDQPGQEANGGRNHNSRRTRAPFSLPGPTYDRTNTTIVVESIPEDFFSEDHVRNFFGKFGPILDVRMQAYKRLAVVKYETHDAADAAYHSPKVIFDNRFVKVYWHRSSLDDEANVRHDADAEVLDPEEIARRQAAAQAAFEERRKREQEATARAEELDRKLQETNAEILRVRRELARVSGNDAGGEEAFSQDLASLQAEAETLFAQQDAVAQGWHGSNGSSSARGVASRGGYRGRGGYAPRARGYRGGAYRGRGGTRTGVKRLDNRPRRIAIKGVEPGSERDEALRQHLFTLPDVLSTTHHPDEPSTLIVNFAERYMAEAFIDSTASLPFPSLTTANTTTATPLEMHWLPNDALGGIEETEKTSPENYNHNNNNNLNDSHQENDEKERDDGLGMGMGMGMGMRGVHSDDDDVDDDDDDDDDDAKALPGGGAAVDHDVDEDMDVAEDEDRWL